MLSDVDYTHVSSGLQLTETGRSLATFLVQHEATHELADMFHRMPLCSSAIFLDLGCGAGPALIKALEFLPRSVIGLDMDRESLLTAKALLEPMRQRYLLVQSDMTRLPFKEGSFSHLCCRLALSYTDQKQAIAEIGRVLNQGGITFLQIHSWRFYAGLLWKEWEMEEGSDK